jgi:hypothetical protein
VNLSAEEILQQHIAAMGEELGRVYNRLLNDVVWLDLKWIQYQRLFLRSPERLRVLKETAGHFFAFIKSVLADDLLLHVARLTDPPQSRGRGTTRENLTLQRLPRLIEDSDLRAEVTELVKAAERAAGPARDHRNRRLAHRDLAIALDVGSDPLAGLSRLEIDATLAAIRAVIERMARHYWEDLAPYNAEFALDHDADLLVFWLRKALRAEERRLQRLREGRALPEDIEREEEL